jgi:hypothetical protein
MLSTDDYRLHVLLYRACGSTAQSSESASTLELGYKRCRQGKLPSKPSLERKLYPYVSDKDLRQDTSYGNDDRLEHGLGSRDMEMGSLLDVFLFISPLLVFFGSRPGTNGVGTGFTTCHWRWSFHACRIRRKVALCGTDR